MLSEDSKLFLRANFLPGDELEDEWSETRDEIVNQGRPAIEFSIHAFVDEYMESNPKMAPFKENIEDNWESAVQYVAGILGMC